jgi:hypothetical protein
MHALPGRRSSSSSSSTQRSATPPPCAPSPFPPHALAALPSPPLPPSRPQRRKCRIPDLTPIHTPSPSQALHLPCSPRSLTFCSANTVNFWLTLMCLSATVTTTTQNAPPRPTPPSIFFPDKILHLQIHLHLKNLSRINRKHDHQDVYTIINAVSTRC